jgi:predicted nucleotidyltransferase component of viral defense system
MEIQIDEWIESSGEGYVESRRAIHIILRAISDSECLSTSMVMKGGTLLGIRYGSSRYTTDIDFSTSGKYQDFDQEKFVSEFNDRLDVAGSELNYGIRCRLQSCKIMPNAQGTFPTLKIKIGHASVNGVAQLKRLEAGQAASVVSIDYSFNESSYNTEVIMIDDGATFVAYSIIDLLAEKIRSVLQQKSRKRNREQDIYDLNFLLAGVCFSDEERYSVLDSLLKKSEGRELDDLLNSSGIRDEEIRGRSAERYPDLEDTVEELPDFDETFERVAVFYESLPWELFGK